MRQLADAAAGAAGPVPEHDDEPTWRRLVAPIVAYKLALLGFVLLSTYMLPTMFQARNFAANFHWPPNAPITRWTTLATWDAQHYLFVAEHGYEAGTTSTAFYPLWPFAIRLAAPLLGGSYLAAALLLANLFSLAALLVLFEWLRERRGSASAGLGVVLLLAAPGAFFLCVPYSEALFLLLAIVLLASLDRDRSALAAAAAFLLPLSRPVGILCLLPITVHVWQHRRRRAPSVGSGADWRSSSALLLAPLLGYATYFAVMRISTGSALAGFHAQSAFRAGSSPLQLLDPLHLVRSFAVSPTVHGPFDSAIDRAGFLWWAATLLPTYRWDRRLFAFSLALGLVPAMTVSFFAYTRYLVPIFPVFAVTAARFRPPGRRPFFFALVAALFALQLLLLLRHANDIWAG